MKYPLLLKGVTNSGKDLYKIHLFITYRKYVAKIGLCKTSIGELQFTENYRI